jgi:hypothetical protein
MYRAQEENYVNLRRHFKMYLETMDYVLLNNFRAL